MTEIIGWFGTSSILLAHAGIIYKYIEVDSLQYHLLNLLGCSSLGFICWIKKAYQPFVLNAIWTAIEITAFFRML